MEYRDSHRASQERRSHRRLDAGVSIRIQCPGQDKAIAAINQDISWGGAQFVAETFPATPPSSLTLTFPWHHGKTFSADAEVVRTERLGDGRTQFGVRFCCVTPEHQRRLEKLLKLLAEREDAAGAASPTPLTDKLEILFNDAEDLQHLLTQMHTGVLSVTAFGAYRMDQSLMFCIGGTADTPEVRIRARVIGQESMPCSDDSGWAHLVSLTLRFEHQLDDLARLLAPIERLIAERGDVGTDSTALCYPFAEH